MDMSVWYLMGAALVFFMQCGFAMVEAGFTRAKNVGNITMKNLMDFCIGTVAFYLLGYNLLCGEGGFVGWGLNPFTGFGETDWSAFVFNLVFCATAATIVSGAMAERTKFITYYQFSSLSGRGSLGLGCNTVAYRYGIYRFCRISMHPYGRWNYSLHWSSNAWTSYR